MENAKAEKPKKKKASGPIRTGAIVPVAIIVAIIYIYFHFFFDGHLRRGAEYVLTQVHGAEVNIGIFETSVFGASLKVGKIQVTDKNQPARDIIRVGEIRFKMLWDALLRAKIVVDEASVLNIQALVPRAKPGYIVPPPPPSKDQGALARVQNEVLDQTRSQFKDNFLGDLANVAGGVDYKDQLKAIEGDLKSSLRISELDKALKEKRVEWDARFKALPQEKDIKDIEARFKALNWKDKDPVKFAQTLNTANDLLKEVKSKVKQVDDTQKDLRGDVGTYSKLVKDLEGFVKQDLEDLQKRMNIPKIDPKEFSQQLFMKEIEKRLVSVRKYAKIAEEYMPPKRTAEEKAERKAEKFSHANAVKAKTFNSRLRPGIRSFG